MVTYEPQPKLIAVATWNRAEQSRRSNGSNSHNNNSKESNRRGRRWAATIDDEEGEEAARQAAVQQEEEDVTASINWFWFVWEENVHTGTSRRWSWQLKNSYSSRDDDVKKKRMVMLRLEAWAEWKKWAFWLVKDSGRQQTWQYEMINSKVREVGDKMKETAYEDEYDSY